MGAHILGDTEIEAGIVDKDDHIGLPLHNIALAERHIAENGRQMEQHGHKTHIGQVTIMAHTGASDGRHQVASEKPERCLWVVLAQGTHEMTGMEVATGLTYNEIILHNNS